MEASGSGKKIAVTGAGGFIGRALVTYLQEKGEEVMTKDS